MSMKRSVWIAVITIITVCCVIGGTVYHIGRGIRFFGRGEMTRKNFDLEEFDVVKIDANLMDVTITPGNQFSLSYEYTDGLEPVYDVKSGTLTIKQKQYTRVGFNNANCSLSLTIPQQEAMKAFDVHTALGNIYIEEIAASKCELKSNMGNCTLKDCSFDESDIETNMGEISVRDTSLGETELKNDMGEVEVDTCTFRDLSIKAAMGSVTVEAAHDLDGYDMDLETDMGDVKVNGQSEGTKYHQKGKDGELEIDADMGSIRVTY